MPAPEKIVILNYDMGNVGSIANMIKRVGYNAIITREIEKIEEATHIILPGVGAFDEGVRKLQEYRLPELLYRKCVVQGVPTLGICLGMQLMGKKSEEGVLEGLGWFDANSVRIPIKCGQTDLKVPHMGWSEISIRRPNAILWEAESEQRFYFVHSYHVVCQDSAEVVATCRYGLELSAIIARKNLIGMQFHPEKSHRYGMQLLRNFIQSP
jgi:imidazole glycerol-phosphate synthase subunit HisH